MSSAYKKMSSAYERPEVKRGVGSRGLLTGTSLVLVPDVPTRGPFIPLISLVMCLVFDPQVCGSTRISKNLFAQAHWISRKTLVLCLIMRKVKVVAILCAGV